MRQRDLLILTIVPMASPTGRQAGLSARRSGAAEFMGKVALARVEVVHRWAPLALLMIAMLASQIGWQAGAHRRKTGAAEMLARAALPQLVVVLENKGVVL